MPDPTSIAHVRSESLLPGEEVRDDELDDMLFGLG